MKQKKTIRRKPQLTEGCRVTKNYVKNMDNQSKKLKKLIKKYC